MTETMPSRRAGQVEENQELNLLDGPYLRQGSVRRAIPEGSQRLLAFVALHRGRVDRRWAAGTLWPAADENRASGNLRSAIWRLRVADIDILDADARTLWLRETTIVDVRTLNDWAGRVIDGTADDADLRVFAFNPEAIDLLPGWYDDWVVFERERLRQRVLHGLEALSCTLLDRGRTGEAVEAAILATSIDPLRESGQKTLIAAHLAERNVSEARRVFLDFSGLLRRELSVAPSAELSLLVQLAHRPGPSAPVGTLLRE